MNLSIFKLNFSIITPLNQALKQNFSVGGNQFTVRRRWPVPLHEIINLFEFNHE